ncbi:MAG TPA: DUF1127 domain-containing protein [Alphaproteobacteria bacterium]|nr:DUF1127 domain-containing protein [Alphaproteobacteria bacterium]
MMQATTTGEHIAGAHIRRAVQREMMLALWRVTTSSIAGAASAYLEWRRKKRAVAELHDLSDRMLKDIGVERHDIERIVRSGQERGQISR